MTNDEIVVRNMLTSQTKNSYEDIPPTAIRTEDTLHSSLQR